MKHTDYLSDFPAVVERHIYRWHFVHAVGGHTIELNPGKPQKYNHPPL